MNMPIRPDLWEITLPALKAAREKGLEHISSGKYYSKLDIPKYEQNDHGWSTTVSRDLLFDKKDSPPDWDHMYGIKAGTFAAISIDDVPEFRSAVDQIRELALADAALQSGVSLLASTDKDAEARGKQIEFEYIGLVEDIVGRAEAMGLSTDEELLEIYLKIERARFADELKGDLIVPLALTPLDLDSPFEVSPNVWIEPLDEPLQRARAASSLYSRRVSPYVIAAASHAIAVKDVIFDNRDRTYRRFGHAEPDLTEVERVIQCLHIISGCDTGYGQIIVRPHDWADDWLYDLPAVWKISEPHRYPEKFDEGGWNKEWPTVAREDIEQLPGLYSALSTAPPNVHLSARRSLRAALRSDDEDKTLDATIGIEALLLANNDRDELTHRMAQRAAAALASEYDPEAIYRLLKKVYEHRSKIVHGRVRTKDTISIGEQVYPAQDVAVILLRLLLTNLLKASPPWTPEALDTKILQALSGPTPESTDTNQK